MPTVLVLHDCFINSLCAPKYTHNFSGKNTPENLDDPPARRSHRINTVFVTPLLNTYSYGEKVFVGCGERSDYQKWRRIPRQTPSKSSATIRSIAFLRGRTVNVHFNTATETHCAFRRELESDKDVYDHRVEHIFNCQFMLTDDANPWRREIIVAAFWSMRIAAVNQTKSGPYQSVSGQSSFLRFSRPLGLTNM
jgi:hypothetical protein